MPGVMDEATQAQRRNRANALKILAESGSAGRAAVADQRTANAAAGTDALHGALAAATGRGAPEGMLSQIGDTVGQSSALLDSASKSADESLRRDLERQRQTSFDYSLSAQRALPVIKAASDRDISYARAQWEEDQRRQAEQQKWAEEQHYMQMAQLNAAKDAQATKDAQWEQVAKSLGLATLTGQQAVDPLMAQYDQLRGQAEMHRAAMDQDRSGMADAHANDYGGPALRATLSANQADHLATTGAPFAGQTGADVTRDADYTTHRQAYEGLHDQLGALAQQIQQQQRAAADPSIDAQRQAYLQIYGNDPMHEALSIGLLKDPTASQQLNDLQAQQGLDFFQQTGASSPQDLYNRERSTAQLGNVGQPREDTQLADKAGFNTVDGMHRAMQTPQYADMVQTIKDMLQAGHVPTPQGDLPASIDTFKFLVNSDPEWQTKPLTAALVIAQFGHMFPSSASVAPS
jgi:hypothetical protein